jgi:hypothetical protein
MTFYMHPELARIIQLMIEAINQAIDDANQNKIRYTAVQGQQHTANGGGSYYTFALEDEWEPAANTSVLIEIDPEDPERTIAGTILSTINARITLMTETPLPRTALAKITLFEATVWLLEKLRAALITLLEKGETPAQMAAKTFGLLPCYEGRGERKARIANFAPDADQTRALTLGMESDRLFVIGPPGTGKTSVEGALAIEYILADKTVLLAAYSNAALDTVMKRLKQYCEESGNGHLIQEHRIVRIGKTKDLTGEEYRDITLQGIVDQHLGRLAGERDQLQQNQSNVEDTLARLSRHLVSLKEQWQKQRHELEASLATVWQERKSLEEREGQRLNKIANRLAAIAEERQAAYEKKQAEEQANAAWSAALQAQIEELRMRQAAFDRKIDELRSFRSSSPASRFVSRLFGDTEKSLVEEAGKCQMSLDEAKQIVIAHEQNRNKASLAAFQAEIQIITLDNEEKRLHKDQQQVTADARWIQTLTTQITQDEQAIERGDAGVAEAEEGLEQEQNRYHRIKERLKEIEDEQRVVTSRVITEAKLIGTTLTGITTSPYLRDRVFNSTIIDEASMASLVIVLVAAARATQHVDIVGDPYQLAPIIKLEDKKKAQLTAYWLGTELFSYLKLTLDDADTGTNQVVLLSQQSRMLPQIAVPDSQYIYGGRLKNRVDPNRTPIQLAPHPEWPLMLVNTGDVDRGKSKDEEKVCQAKRPPHSSSKYNLYHVDCVVQLVQLLLPQLSISTLSEPQIGVVTPYSAQKTKIQNALRQLGLLHRVHVGTVHGFQSMEYPCLIFDITEGYGVPIRQFTSNTWGHRGIPHDATRLINVAHSRARDKLIYIANIDYIRQEPHRRNHVLTQFVNYVYKQGYMDSSELFEQTGLESRESFR